MRSRQSSVAGAVARLSLFAALLGIGPCYTEAERADLNWDGYVDLSDAFLVLGCVSVTGALDAECARADLDGDGDVEGADLALVVRHLGEVLFAPALPAFTPESIAQDGNGVVYLFAPEQQRILRWSLPRQRALRPLQIGAGAIHVAIATTTERLHVAYSNGRITRFDLGYPAVEQPFVAAGHDIRGLAAANDVLFAAVAEPDGTSHYTFRPDGAVAAVKVRGGASREFTWSPANQRLYHFRDDTFPNDLLWKQIDPATGAFTGQGDSPYHGEIELEPPIRVARDASRVLLGTGQFYDGTSLKQLGALPFAPLDAAWQERGELLTLTREEGGSSLLRRFDAGGRLIEVTRFAGEPLRVLDASPRVAVITQIGGRPVVHVHRPSADSDRDRVPNAEDAFPLDPAASRDSDGDGHPDAWNRGRTGEDSTTGLVLDAFPQDEECQLPVHGLPGQPDVCDLAHGIPDYQPLRIETDGEGVIYLLSPENARIYRWSVVSDYHLKPIRIGAGAYQMAWSAQNRRLYIGYENGAIRQIDVHSEPLEEQPFTALDRRVLGLVAAGPFVFADDSNRKRSFAPDGALVSTANWSYGAERWVYSGIQRRLYHTAFGFSNQVLAGEIDPASGVLGVLRGSTTSGQWTKDEAVRVAQDGSLVVRGGGVVHDAATLVPVGTLPTSFTEAQWLDDGRLLTIREVPPGQTLLEQWDASRRLVHVASYPGAPRRVVAAAEEIAVITSSGGQPRFASYEPTLDGDEDGVPIALDAFPLDPAASLDSDGDGAPDAWNPGTGPEDSTTGLALDAFPFDEACQLEEHGLPQSPDVCDLAHGIPVYEPVKIVADGLGVIYLLSPENRRVYRWSIGEDYHLAPLRIGAGALSIAFSEPHGALYLSYESGAVTRIDPQDPDLQEQPFAKLPKRVWGLHPVDGLLLVAGTGTSKLEHHLFDASGTDLAFSGGKHLSSDFAWDPVSQRLYYFHDGLSPNDLLWSKIDPTTGMVVGNGQSPYHGDFTIAPPIRVSADGARVLLGSGDVYRASSLEVIAKLGHSIREASWLSDASLVTLRAAADGDTLLEHRDADRRVIRVLDYPGKPLRLLETRGEQVVVTRLDGKPAFFAYQRSIDGDEDGVADPEDAFPIDPAASLDADADGAPDAWNASSDESDSTTGLHLDVFPAERACQRAEHGVAGACDFHLVMPPAPAQGFCSEDVVLPATAAGVFSMDASSDFVPLCSGWIVTTDGFSDLVRIANATDGREAARIRLSSHPGDIELDELRRRLYVALPKENALARIDLNDGSTDVIPMPGPPFSLALGSDGGLLVAMDRNYEGTLYWLAEGAAAVVGGWPIGGRLIRWNPVYAELVAVRMGLSPVRMLRYGFDATGGPVLRQTNFRAGGNAQDLTISPDGEHVALADGAGNIGGYTIADYVATNIESYRGEWATGAYPSAVAFDAASGRLLASNGGALLVFGVLSFAEQERWTPPGCAYHRVRGVGFSRGGAIAFLRQACGIREDTTRYHWFVAEDD